METDSLSRSKLWCNSPYRTRMADAFGVIRRVRGQLSNHAGQRWLTLGAYSEELKAGVKMCAYSPPRGEHKGQVCAALVPDSTDLPMLRRCRMCAGRGLGRLAIKESPELKAHLDAGKEVAKEAATALETERALRASNGNVDPVSDQLRLVFENSMMLPPLIAMIRQYVGTRQYFTVQCQTHNLYSFAPTPTFGATAWVCVQDVDLIWHGVRHQDLPTSIRPEISAWMDGEAARLKLSQFSFTGVQPDPRGAATGWTPSLHKAQEPNMQ